nr:MAG TPA: hypothetical protein [Caudoviricetes sp.]
MGFLSQASYDYYFRKVGISFHLQFYLLRGEDSWRDYILIQVHSLCSACDYVFKHSLPL